LTSSPSVSVIMNCYNGAKYLRAAIESVLTQSYADWELVFWDNQSTDESADIVRSYADPRIKYFYAPVHTFLYEARNCAVQKSTGELLAFLDVDDTWLPAKLELQAALFADAKVGFACGNYWVDSESKGRRWLAHKRPLPGGHVLDELLKFYFVGLVTLMVRRAALDSLSYPFDPRYHIIGDLDLVIRLSMSWKVGSIQAPIAVYRLHGNNESTKHRGRHADELEVWSGEMKDIEAIKASRNAHFLRSHFAYIKAINFVLLGDKRGAYGLLRQLPWGQLKLRLWASLLLPRFVVQRVKN
jgi:glycosyltransferase involved in cell wall biosynthesis